MRYINLERDVHLLCASCLGGRSTARCDCIVRSRRWCGVEGSLKEGDPHETSRTLSYRSAVFVSVKVWLQEGDEISIGPFV